MNLNSCVNYAHFRKSGHIFIIYIFISLFIYIHVYIVYVCSEIPIRVKSDYFVIKISYRLVGNYHLAHMYQYAKITFYKLHNHSTYIYKPYKLRYSIVSQII